MHGRSRVTTLLVSVAAVAVAVAGCGGSPSGKSSTGAAMRSGSAATTGGSAVAAGPASAGVNAPLGAATSGSATLGRPVAPAQPKVVVTGDVTMTVGKGLLQASFDRISGLATGAGGFVSDSSLTNGSGTPTARLVLRIANDQVQAVLGGLRQVGTVTSQQLGGKDVTGQVVDVNAQLTTLQAEQQAVRALLDKATSIGDILQIQGQLFTLQTQIQQLSGQQGTLADQTAYATISVELTAPVAAAPVARPSHSVWSRAGHAAAANSAAVVRAVVLTVGWLAPILVIAALVGIPLLVWRRRRTSPEV